MADKPQPITLDLASLTLGEMAAAELASGQSFDKLLQTGSATRMLLALFIRELRSSGAAPSWHELSDHRPLARRSSTSPSSPAGRRTPAQD